VALTSGVVSNSYVLASKSVRGVFITVFRCSKERAAEVFP
jgi:hypothetical protein